MAVSKGVTTRSSKKIVLPVDADRTTVVLAQGPDPPHITQTLVDCNPTTMDREPAKIVLPLGGDRTPVVHAREPALPHITQTLADCTPTAMDREPASPI